MDVDKELYLRALKTIRHHLDSAGVEYSEDEGDLVIGSHRLGLSITFDEFVEQGDLVIAPVDARIHLDGDSGESFRVGTLGIGKTPEEAIDSAIGEWHLLAASPLLAALGADVGRRRRDAGKQTIAGWDLFAGRAGFRGKIPSGLEPDGPLFRKLLLALHKVVAQWNAPRSFKLRSIFLMTSVAEGSTEIQAAVDGLVDGPLCEALAKLSWPVSDEAYLYKQLFVLRWEGSS